MEELSKPGYSSYYLLEEERKSREYITSDEIVHLLAFFQVQKNAFLAITKNFVEGRVWIEAHLTLGCSGNVENESHYIATYEFDTRLEGSWQIRKIKDALVAMNRNTSMLVNCTQSVKSPKKVAMGG